MTEVRSVEAYLDLFSNDPVRISKALERAHDMRKFEIDLYWRRATYFWTLIAAAFVGFFSSLKGSPYVSFAIGSIGLVVSVSWYTVNRGGMSWQSNWETHIDLLEDEITGPLYKTLINRKPASFWELTGPFPFSPARSNAVISLYLVMVWFVMTAWTFSAFMQSEERKIEESMAAGAIAIVTIVAILGLLIRARSKRGSDRHQILAQTRAYKDN